MKNILAFLRLLVIGLMLGLALPAMAQETPETPEPVVTCSPDSPDPDTRCNSFMSDVVGHYLGASSQAINNLLPYATRAFQALLAIEIMFMLLMWVLVADQGWTYVVNGLLKRIATVFLFYFLLTNMHAFTFKIVETFSMMGAVAGAGSTSGIARVCGGGGAVTAISPGCIIDFGSDMFFRFADGANRIPFASDEAASLNPIAWVGDQITASVKYIYYAGLFTVLGFVFWVMTLWVGFELMLTYIQGYLMLALSTFLFALAANRVTEKFAHKAWDLVINFGVKLMVITFISTVGLVVIDQALTQWEQQGAQASLNPTIHLQATLYLAAIAIIYALLVHQLPKLVSDMLNGTVSMGAADAMQSAGRGMQAAGAGVGAAGMWMGAVAGGNAALSQALRGGAGAGAGGGATPGPAGPAPSAPSGVAGGASGSASREGTGSTGGGAVAAPGSVDSGSASSSTNGATSAGQADSIAGEGTQSAPSLGQRLSSAWGLAKTTAAGARDGAQAGNAGTAAASYMMAVGGNLGHRGSASEAVSAGASHFQDRKQKAERREREAGDSGHHSPAPSAPRNMAAPNVKPQRGLGHKS